MIRGLPKTWLNLLLAATVLTGGGLPPAIRHAHEGGSDLSHRHNGDRGIHQDCGGQSAQAVHAVHLLPCDPSPAPAKYTHLELVRHLHFKLLSLQLTLSDNGVPANNHGNNPSSELVFVRVGREMMASTAHANQDGARTFAPLFQGVLSDSPATSLTAAYSSDSVASTLLCDRARHERSGVHLI